MADIAALDEGRSLFFSHNDPATADYLIGVGKSGIPVPDEE